MSSLCRRYGSSTRRATAIGAVLSGTCPPAWVTDEAGNRYERYRVFPGPAEEYWPEFRLLEEPEGKITAIEVEALVFNILRTDRPREVETRSYTSTYNPLNWVIELP